MPMGGLLGYDFFSRFVVRVNYDTKPIDLLDPSDYAYAGSVSPSERPRGSCRTSLRRSRSRPVLHRRRPDHRRRCGRQRQPHVAVREGAPAARAGAKDARRWVTRWQVEKEFFAQTSVRGKLAGLTLGGVTLKDIPCNLMVGTKGAYASTSFSGTIGEGVLHRFNTVYDYSRSVMILEANAESAKPFPARKTFGATFLSDGPSYTRFTVTGVRKASPAETAGLRKDDLVVAADGKPPQK